MHEISLCQSLLGLIETQAKLQPFRRVKTVFLEVGKLAGVELDALRFGFDAVMKDSLAAGARLEVIEIVARGWCSQCNMEVVVQQRFAACPICGAVALQINAGDELRLKELEVE